MWGERVGSCVGELHGELCGGAALVGLYGDCVWELCGVS